MRVLSRARATALAVVGVLVASLFTFALPVAANAAGTASISGTVTADTGGAAVANAYVRLYKKSGTYWSYQTSVRTISTGTYSFPSLDAGDYTLEFEAPSAANLVTEWWNNKADRETATAITVAAGQAKTGLSAGLAKGATITGKISAPRAMTSPTVLVMTPDAPNGYYRWDVTSQGARALANGTYSISGLRAGTYSVVFYDASQAANFAPQFYGATDNITLAQGFTVAAGATVPNINGTLVNGATISGKITDAAGAVVPSSYAVVARKITVDGKPFWEYDTVTADSSGAFLTNGLAAGTWAVKFVGPYGQGYTDVYFGGGTSYENSGAFSLAAGQAKADVNGKLAKKLTAGSPTISGTPVYGATLTAKPGTWTASTTLKYQWYANGAAISGATKSTLKLAAGQKGKQITVKVTGSKSGYATVSKTSAKSLKVATVATPTIAGTKKVGATLTAKPGAWTSKTVFSYQWYASGKAISKATKSTFKLTSAQKGKTITVKVTGKLSGYPTVAKTSAATGKIG